jgi:hypothetical protein
MSVVVAYLLVTVLSTVALTVGALVVGAAARAVLSWMPASAMIAGICGGIAGVMCAIAFGFFLFRWFGLAYGLGPFLASLLPLTIVYLNDNRKTQQLHAAAEALPEELREVGMADALALAGAATGYLIGAAGAVVWFILGS